MNCECRDVVAYTVDADNRFTWMCEHWWPFARDNEAPELHPDRVMGTDLLSYISDPTSRHLYELLLARSRRDPTPMSLDIRCDSPTKRRFIVITMRGAADGSVEFESRILQEEARPKVPALAHDAVRQELFIAMCSWCKRVRHIGQWFEIEQVLRLMRIFEEGPQPQITHTICPDCLASVELKL